jgi:hypothetical protein
MTTSTGHTEKLLGVPLAVIDKECGPTATIVFLGIIVDTIRRELRLTEDKLKRLLVLHGGPMDIYTRKHAAWKNWNLC